MYLLFFYFCIPKIDFINFSNFPTGIRIQDFIALFLLSLNFKFILRFLINVKKTPLIIIASLIIYNSLIGNLVNSVVVLSRIFEYFVIGFSFYKIKEKQYLFFSVLSLNLLLAIMQKSHLIKVIDPIRGIYISETMNGSFGTPAEFSYFLIFILFILTRYIKSKYSKFLFPISLENSISAAYLSAIFLFDYKKVFRLSLLPIYFYGALFLSSSFQHMMTFTHNTFSSITSTISPNKNYNLSRDNIILKKYREALPRQITSGTEADPISLRHREFKWRSAVKELLNSKPIAWIFGLGINNLGPLDGGLIKYLCEYGLIGLLFFVYLSKKISSNAFGLIFAVNIAFDAFVSSVISPLIILIYLYEIYKKS